VIVGKQLHDAVGARILADGYSYGDYDISVIGDVPDDVTMAAVAGSIAAGGAALRKAPAVRPNTACSVDAGCAFRPPLEEAV